MKAKISNIVNKERHELSKVIPLDMPYSLSLDVCNLCNFKCKFCAMQNPNEKLNFRKQFMSFDIYKKIIDDLFVFNDKLKVLRVSGQGEPLLNPEYTKMIRYAKNKSVTEYIETITNGSKLEPNINQDLVNSGIDRIRISIEAVNEEDYYDITGTRIDFEKFVFNIKDLYKKSRGKCEIYIKTVDAAVETDKKKENFYNIFGDICDQIFIDRIIPLWSDFNSIYDNFKLELAGIHGQEFKKVRVCPYSFYSLIINSDGEVTLCCADWKRKYVVGDLKKESFFEVWNGERLKNFWCDMLKGKKNDYEMCRKCVLPMYDCNDDIDETAKVILERLLSE